MPEGEPHAATNYITRLLAGLLIVLIGIAALAWPNHAGAAESWAAQWVDGYETGFCWTRNPCEYIPPVQIPYPEDGQSDGYVAGLKRGLEDGRE
jgi:hypothetical protein